MLVRLTNYMAVRCSIQRANFTLLIIGPQARKVTCTGIRQLLNIHIYAQLIFYFNVITGLI